MEQSQRFVTKEDLKRLRHIALPEKEEGYTIPEIVDMLNDQLSLIKAGTKSTDEGITKRKTLYQEVRRALEGQPHKKVSERKTTYTSDTVNHILNSDRLYKYLLKQISEKNSKEMEDFKKYKERAEKQERAYNDFMDSMNNQQEDSVEDSMQDAVNDKISQMKIECLLDVAVHLFKFDEELARKDVWCNMTIDYSNPTTLDLAANERMHNISNYYDKSIIDTLEKLLQDKK